MTHNKGLAVDLWPLRYAGHLLEAHTEVVKGKAHKVTPDTQPLV